MSKASSPTVEICFSPLQRPLFDLKGKVVVMIDILRASTTICTALASGINGVIPVKTLEECLSHKGENMLLAAERGGAKPEGFLYGNSPFDYIDQQLNGKTLVLTTTNGTNAIHNSLEADEIIVGAFVNLKACSRYLSDLKKDVVLYCAGWKGHFSYEDSLFAGALTCELLLNNFVVEGDAGIAAINLYDTYKTDIYEAFKNSSHYQRLAMKGLDRDIQYSSQLDLFDLVPRLEGERLIKHS